MKLTSHDLELLDRYNQFLYEHSYVDTDIELEEPTAINMFQAEIREERIDQEVIDRFHEINIERTE